MNISYDNVSLDNVTPETLERYSFPADKEMIKRHLYGHKDFSQSELWGIHNKSKFDAYLLVGAVTLGFVGYTALLMPKGKLARDLIESKQSVFKRVGKRLLPFIGIAATIVISRDYLESLGRYGLRRTD